MHEYVSHHHQDHRCLPGCNVLCYNAMNRILNIDMVIIPLVQIYFIQAEQFVLLQLYIQCSSKYTMTVYSKIVSFTFPNNIMNPITLLLSTSTLKFQLDIEIGLQIFTDQP